jgi:hypothetical protein
MRLYRVSHNDGEWRSGDTPSEIIAAPTPAAAKEKFFAMRGQYRRKEGDTWVETVKVPGYTLALIKKKPVKNAKENAKTKDARRA